jgi:hypothetical protein
MTSFDEDFAAALRGDSGYRGIEPPTAAALYRLGLITEEQAWEGAREYEADWKAAWASTDWWQKTAELAWLNNASFLTRFINAGVPPLTWKSQWLKEHRGW